MMSMSEEMFEGLFMHVCGCRALVSPHETITRPLGPPRGLKAWCIC